VTFFDTNVLVYFTINQDEHKLATAQQSIYDAIKNDSFVISPMVMSEYIFILSKYKIVKQHQDKVDFFSTYIQGFIDKDKTMQAYELCQKIDFCKNINDVIHLKIAEEHCDRLVTFDSDFKKLQRYTDIKIEVLV
jgi:predicted nucleic acid-binding protein